MDEYFEIWKQNINNLILEHPLQIISWEATRRCNLKCVHCGSPSEIVNLKEELGTDEIITAFKQIADDFDMTRFRHINITGGEPFVRSDLLDILKSISKYSFYRNIDIQTNGLYIAENPWILPELKKYGVTGLGISIDGLKETHDAFRKKKGGFDLAFNAAKLAVETGLVVTVSVVVHSKNITEIEPLYELVKSNIKPRVFRLMFLDPIGRTDVDSEYLLNMTEKKWVIHFLQEKYAESCERYGDKDIMMVELGCGGWFGKELEGTFRPFIFHCIAGINNLGILYDGKLASCSNIPREFVEGDLRTENIRTVWETRYQRYRNRDWLRKERCENCEDWEYCHGGPMHLTPNKNFEKCTIKCDNY
jgi:radical SAM protein with 4Fe4S-binding SPASM domain